MCVAGFGDRLLAEVKKLTPKDIKIRVSSLYLALTSTCVHVYISKFNLVGLKIWCACIISFQISAPQDRLYSTWMGWVVIPLLLIVHVYTCLTPLSKSVGIKLILDLQCHILRQRAVERCLSHENYWSHRNTPYNYYYPPIAIVIGPRGKQPVDTAKFCRTGGPVLVQSTGIDWDWL